MKRIGYIGTGIMGAPMALNLLKAGFEVTVWNRTPAKAEAVIGRGATWAATPAEAAADVEAVCLNVTDTPDVEHVLFSEQGVAAAAPIPKGLVVIDHSTIAPAATRQFAQRLERSQIDFLDAPVSGGDVGAKAGTLSVMVGGKAETFERCMPIFQAVGKSITYLGPAGSGQACKACNQILCGIHMLAVCESMALARKEGVDLKKMLAVTTAGAGGSWALANLGPRIADNDMDPGFMIDLINKDLAIVRAEAAAANLPLPATNLSADLFRAAAVNGLGRAGTQAMSRIYQQLANLTYAEDESS